MGEEAVMPQPEIGTHVLQIGTHVQDKCIKEYKPSRMECLRDYSINIEFLSIGCIIRVGCKSVPFATVNEGLKALNDYIANPYETRTIWQERFAREEKL